jgi:hypothetical protein
MPHRGQARTLAFARAGTKMTLSFSVTCSRIHPAGSNEDIRKLLAVALTLLRNHPYSAMQNHQM